MLRRREFIRASAVGTGALAFGSRFWQDALGVPAQAGPGPYGPLQDADANGIRLPKGFKSRIVAQGGQPVPGTTYTWPVFPDGQATYRTEDGGFILVTNTENPPDLGVDDPTANGGASAIRFRADGAIADAYRILEGTRVNCAGGPTPWGTWLSCEEHTRGQVWECDPTGKNPAVARPALGLFEHEAVAVDGDGKHVYLSEDNAQGGFYRFTADRWPDLSAGTLEVAKVGAGGVVEWVKVPDPSAASAITRDQVEGITRFNRGEGMWFDSGIVYLCTTNDHKIHAYDTKTGRIDVVYDVAALTEPVLTNVDNVTVSVSGDIFVCEDTGSTEDPGLDIGIITPEREVTRFLKITNPQYVGSGEARSEISGVVFDPAGDRMFFASQRGNVSGVTFEVTGPFRKERVPQAITTRVHIPPRARTRTILGGGFPFIVATDKPVKVTATLSAALPSERGRDRTTLARLTRDIDEPGRFKLHLRPKGRIRSRIARERSFRARLTIVLTDGAGGRRSFNKSIRIARRYATD
jgi:uncharacterized protein